MPLAFSSYNELNSVLQITHEDIDRSFGGYGGPSRSYYSGVYSSSMNAYMLMYRQIDRERNVLPLKEEEFPPHIKVPSLVRKPSLSNCEMKLIPLLYPEISGPSQ